MFLALISLCNGTCWGAEKQVPSDSTLQTTCRHGWMWKSLSNMPIPQMTAFPTARQSFQRATSVTAEAWILHPFYTGITWTFLPKSALCLMFCVFFVGTCRFGVIRCSVEAGFALQSSPMQHGGRCPCQAGYAQARAVRGAPGSAAPSSLFPSSFQTVALAGLS